jgi:hypothetical protein
LTDRAKLSLVQLSLAVRTRSQASMCARTLAQARTYAQHVHAHIALPRPQSLHPTLKEGKKLCIRRAFSLPLARSRASARAHAHAHALSLCV